MTRLGRVSTCQFLGPALCRYPNFLTPSSCNAHVSRPREAVRPTYHVVLKLRLLSTFRNSRKLWGVTAQENNKQCLLTFLGLRSEEAQDTTGMEEKFLPEAFVLMILDVE